MGSALELVGAIVSAVGESLVYSAGIIVSLGVILRAGIAVYRAAKRIESTYELVNHELRPNSGSSLWDAVHRVDRRVEVLEGIDRRSEPRHPTDEYL